MQFKKPIPLMAASIRGMLRMFQNEWDGLMQSNFALEQQHHTARQELSHALYQMNLEYFAIDTRKLLDLLNSMKASSKTVNDVMSDIISTGLMAYALQTPSRALEELFDDEESSQKADACLNVMATRIATVFTSLTEFPLVRYRAAKSLDAMTITTLRDLVPMKLATGVWNCLMKYKQTIENFPMSETCELFILVFLLIRFCDALDKFLECLLHALSVLLVVYV
ncbi:hypothetical protein WN944_001316 [Citrus x changshan-huyou]|uniref:Pre-mRNA-processing factor 19 n=1 Tax=Citrus x changshan-huyou TaxID=2935761 RepID=A0AAP0MGA4_9ROSI